MASKASDLRERGTGLACRRWLGEAVGLAPASVARALAALSGIYTDVLETAPGLLAGNPFQGVRRPRLDKTPATPSLTVAEAQKFIAAAGTVSPRAHALALVLLGTGLRISEVLNANIGDLRQHRGGLLALTVERKGGRRAHVALPARVTQALQEYFRARAASRSRSLVQASRAPRYQSWPLFEGHDGRLTASEARRELERVCRACGWPSARVTAHGLRHTFATTAVETCELPVRQVQHALGHANVNTTETYLHDDRLAHRVNKLRGSPPR